MTTIPLEPISLGTYSDSLTLKKECNRVSQGNTRNGIQGVYYVDVFEEIPNATGTTRKVYPKLQEEIRLDALQKGSSIKRRINGSKVTPYNYDEANQVLLYVGKGQLKPFNVTGGTYDGMGQYVSGGTLEVGEWEKDENGEYVPHPEWNAPTTFEEYDWLLLMFKTKQLDMVDFLQATIEEAKKMRRTDFLV